MEPIIYFFGSLPGGFSSYPQDHTKAFFEEFLKRSKNMLQIVVHRKDNLLHYGYVRKFSNNYFGICICIDKIYNDVGFLFKVLDDVFAEMVKKGDILRMTTKTSIEWSLKSYASESVAIHEYSKQIINKLNITNSNTQILPPVDFSISINDCLELSLESDKDKITEATKHYSNLYIVKTNAEIERVTGFVHIVETKNKEIDNLKQEIRGQKKRNAELSAQLTKAKVQQRNLIWLSVLGAIALILGVVVWNKVLFPSEVTRYQTEHFLYYGPMQNKKPHGEGVAFYPKDDQDGRRYYIGHFVNGERQDTTAMLYYQNGDYFYGSMDGDKFLKGIFYSNSDKSHFEGSFVDNKPYDGTWYNHEESYKLKDGEMK